MADLLLEIGTEEIPSSYVRAALTQLLERAPTVLAETGLADTGAAVEVYGTPRRLALVAHGLRNTLPAESAWDSGPPVAIAFDADGNPTKAAQGFARGKGVDVSELATRDGRIGVERQVPERPAAEVLVEALTSLVTGLHWPKTMRWGAGSERFSRPVHWVVALVGDDVVSLTLGRVAAGRRSRGHRFNAPDEFDVTGPDQWLAQLRERHVEPDGGVRAERIRADAQALAREAGGRLVDDPANVLDNAYLTEQPLACLGRFAEGFLDVPREVLVSAMRGHQRYFSIEDEAGALLPAFVAVNNTIVEDPALVVAGHERVLRARLADARFFWDEDRKRNLVDRVHDLSGVVFLARLDAPTVRDKAERLQRLADHLSGPLGADPLAAERAAQLCKADLTTLMVQEFPDLQGVMGRYYAQASGEPDVVAEAVREHYLPRGADDELPVHAVGAVVALADRLDTLAAGFACGLQPTGSKDAYGLRRAALGVIRILRGRSVHLSVRKLVAEACRVLGEDVPQAELSEFVLGRLRHQLVAEGCAGDVTDSVLAAGWDDPINVASLATTLSELRGRPELLSLFAGLKRVRNIVLKADGVDIPAVSPDRFEEAAEHTLYDALGAARSRIDTALDDGDYAGALEPLVSFKDPIDRFFDEVLVMAKDPDLQRNRLALCKEVSDLFGKLADFSRIAT